MLTFIRKTVTRKTDAHEEFLVSTKEPKMIALAQAIIMQEYAWANLFIVKRPLAPLSATKVQSAIDKRLERSFGKIRERVSPQMVKALQDLMYAWQTEVQQAAAMRYLTEVVLLLRREALDLQATERAKTASWEKTQVLVDRLETIFVSGLALKFLLESDCVTVDKELCDNLLKHASECYSAETCPHTF